AGGSIQVTGTVGNSQGLSVSPAVTLSFDATNDFVGLGQLLGSVTPTVGQGATVNIPLGLGVSLNSGDQAGDKLPPLVYQKTYQFNPLNGSLNTSSGEILANGVVVATESNGQDLD